MKKNPAPAPNSATAIVLIESTKGVEMNTDRKSTRLNSSHSQISYAVFCLKKKKKHIHQASTLSQATRPDRPTCSRHCPHDTALTTSNTAYTSVNEHSASSRQPPHDSEHTC